MTDGDAMMNRVALAVLGCAWTLLAGGCALVDNQVKLSFTPPPEAISHDRGGVDVMPATNAAGLVKNKTGALVIGAVRNGFGGKTADIITNDSPEEWLRSAIVAELRSRGYDAKAAASAGNSPTVAATIVTLGNEFEVNFLTVGDQVTTRVKFRVSRGEQVLGEFEASGRSDERNMISHEAAKTAAYKASMDLLMKDAGPKLEALLNANHPQ
jgi:hypothetical protein